MDTRRTLILDIAVAAILLLNWLFIATCFSRIEAYGADSSIYIGLAESLGETGRYEFNATPHTKYPPGIPVIIHLSSQLFGADGFTDYVRLIGIFAILAAAACYCYLRLYNSTYAFVITLLLLSSPWFFQLSTMAVLSEMPYIFSTMTALLCACLLDKAPPGKRWPLSILLCVLVAASILIRTVAVALLTGLLLSVLFSFLSSREQGRRRLLLFMPAMSAGLLVFMLWNIWAAFHRIPFYKGQYMDSYFAQLLIKDPHIPDLGQASMVDILLRFGDNTSRIVADLSQLGLNYPYIASTFYSPAVILPLLFLSAGLWSEFKHRGPSVAGWYLLCYIGIFALWPFQEGPRFILPIFPLAALFFFVGANHIWHQMRSCPERYAFYCLLFAISLLAVGLADLTLKTGNLGRQELLSIVFWAAAAFFSLTIWKDYRGLASLISNTGPRLTAAVLGTLWALFVLIVVAGYFQQVPLATFNIAPDPKRYPHSHSVAAAEWIDRHVSKEVTIMAEQNAIIHRLTGNRVTPFPVTQNAEIIKKVVDRHAVGYLIVNDTREYTYFLPTEEKRLELLRERYPGLLNLIHRAEGFRILSVAYHDRAAAPGK